MSLKKKVYPPPPPWRMCFERFMDTLASGTVWSSIRLMSLGNISQFSLEAGLPSQPISPLKCESHFQNLIFQGWHLTRRSVSLWTSILYLILSPLLGSYWIVRSSLNSNQGPEESRALTQAWKARLASKPRMESTSHYRGCEWERGTLRGFYRKSMKSPWVTSKQISTEGEWNMPPQKTLPGRKDHSELKAVFVSLVFFILFLFEGGFLGEGKCFRVFFCFYILKVVLKKQIPKQLSGLHLFPKSRTYIYNVVFSSPF